MSKKHARKAAEAAGKSRRIPQKTTLPWKWIIAGAAVILAIAASILLLQPKYNPPEISIEQAYQKLQQGVFFVDVRTQEEWQEIRVPGVPLIPLDELPDRLNELPGDQEIVVICRSGNRSKKGAEILYKAGIAQVSSMAGGIKAWAQAGYPVEEGQG